MPHAEYQVTIARPLSEVFAFFADCENDPQWRTAVAAISRVSGIGLGTRYKQTLRGPMGRTIAADFEITEYVPNASLAFAVTAGPVRPVGRYRFTEMSGETIVDLVFQADLHGIKKRLIAGMVSKSLISEVHALDRAKAILET